MTDPLFPVALDRDALRRLPRDFVGYGRTPPDVTWPDGSKTPLHLLLAVFKFDHMEWAIEKATELGVSSHHPILARRTEKHLAQPPSNEPNAGAASPSKPPNNPAAPTIPEIADPITLKPALEQETIPHPHPPQRNRTATHPHPRPRKLPRESDPTGAFARRVRSVACRTSKCRMPDTRRLGAEVTHHPRHRHRPRRRLDPRRDLPLHPTPMATSNPRPSHPPRRNRRHRRHRHRRHSPRLKKLLRNRSSEGRDFSRAPPLHPCLQDSAPKQTIQLLGNAFLLWTAL